MLLNFPSNDPANEQEQPPAAPVELPGISDDELGAVLRRLVQRNGGTFRDVISALGITDAATVAPAPNPAPAPAQPDPSTDPAAAAPAADASGGTA